MYDEESEKRKSTRKDQPGLDEMICPKCGRSSKDVPFHGFICMDDFLAEKKIKVPASILFQICREGDKMSVKKWVTEWKDIQEQIRTLVKVRGAAVKCSDIDLGRQTATIDIVFDGDEKNKITKIIPLDVRYTLCDVHTKAVRGYYESIIQIRPPEKWDPMDKDEKERMELKMKRMADKMISVLQSINHEMYIKRETLKKGYVLYTSSTSATYKAMGELGLKTIVSRKLWTAKRGKELFRSTFLVRVELK